MSHVPPPPTNMPFYRALEDRHRGSRELIKQRLRVYLPFINAAAAVHPGHPVLDAGCGRGEWLELLQDHHLSARGVDTDLDMLAACSGLGLDVVHTDVLSHLHACPDHSLLAVTGFHIAEHLPFAQLQTLVAQAWRVLVPGGLLILETPNPENLLVGAASFYIDPTHQRPLPTQLLSFLAEHQGFAPVQLLLLQEEPRLTQNLPVSLYDVLAHVSPDYAIVAHTPVAGKPSASSPAEGEKEGPNQPAAAAVPEVGVSLFALADRYELGLQQRLHSLQLQITAQLQATQAARHEVERAASQNHILAVAQQQLAIAQQQLAAECQRFAAAQQQLSADCQHLAAAQQQLAADSQHLATAQQQLAADSQHLASAHQQLSAAQQQLSAQQAAVYASLSWRLTAPLRWVASLVGFDPGRRKP